MSWPIVKMDSLKSPGRYTFVGGPFGSELTTRDYISEGVPVIRGNNLSGTGKFLDDDFVFVSEEKAGSLQSNLAYPGDLIFTQRGTLGQVGLIPKNAKFDRYIVSQSQMKLTADESQINPLFVYYYFSLPSTIQKILNSVSSSGVPHINLSTLKAFQIPVPPRPVQGSIIDLIKPYDDLIENNQRRIGLLEEAARLLYREWFVYFRFPGHEHVKIAKGLPDGWKRTKLGSVLTLQRGFDLPIASRIEGDVPVYGSTGVVGKHNTPKVTTPTVITGRSGSLGSVCFVDDPCWPLNTSLWVKEFKSVSPYFAYFLLQNMNLAKFNGGASVPTLDRNVVHAVDVVIPTNLLAILFDDQVRIVFAQKKLLEQQNQKLAEARDLLLPRLMNGEIAV
jgi:type I restriction enzyme, S subunit